jgi:hypothetical protein
MGCKTRFKLGNDGDGVHKADVSCNNPQADGAQEIRLSGQTFLSI